MKRRVGFIGLGMMGNPMSKNLLKAGFDLVIWNRTASKMKELVQLGARPASSPKEVSQLSEVIITMLTDPKAVKEVILGDNGVIEGLHSGSVVIDMSTISPAVSRTVAYEISKKGGKMLDAPVSGSVSVAAQAALTIQVGGEKEVFEQCYDIFSALGKNIFYVGKNGMGCYVKLVANSIMATHMVVLAEAIGLGIKAGIPIETLMEVLKHTGAASRILEVKGSNLIKGDYSAKFMLKHLFKDLGLTLNTAAEDLVPLPLISLVYQTYTQAMVSGWGEADFSAISAMIGERAGVIFKK